ncbi:MAG: four helix bundle protein [Ignavibacteriae bacterium]|nr:MAG: four helix bundle protein [Ignavibacteriota bacterium]
MSFSEELRTKTKKLALRVIKLFQSLPKTDEAKMIGVQLFRSATSTAANYRAACRERSTAEFTSKLSIVVEEADETVFWLELLAESKIVEEIKLQCLMNEYLGITKILSHARKTIKKGKK